MNTASARTGPMTRAQKFQWYIEKGIIIRQWDLPPGFTAAAAHRVLTSISQQFEIVRTTFDVVDGRIQQVVGPPHYRPQLAELDVDPNTEPPVDEMYRAFDASSRATTGQRPVQFSLIRVRGIPKWMIMVADHVALDFDSANRIHDAANRIHTAFSSVAVERDALDGSRWLGPLDLADEESSERGWAERSRAKKYLINHFESAPGPAFVPAPASAPHYFRASLAFADGPDVLAMIWRRWQVSPPAAVLAAFAMAVSRWAAADRYTVNISVSNRHSDFLGSIVGATAQRTPVQLAGCDGTFGAAAAAAARALLVATRHGRYDPLDLLETRIRVGHERGIDLAPDLAYNFVIPPETWKGWLAAAPRVNNDPPADESVSWRATSENRYEYRASLSVTMTATSLPVVQLHGESSAISAKDSTILLKSVLALLRQASTGADAAIRDICPNQRPRMPRQFTEPRGHRHDLAEVEPTSIRCAGTSAADGADHGPAHRPTGTGAELAVRAAFAGTGSDHINLGKCYVCSGGQLEVFPRFQELLADQGFRGATFDDVLRGIPLRLLASRLELHATDGRSDRRPTVQS